MFDFFKKNKYDRVLPDFLILGAQKSGTSSLFTYLSEHPQLVGASRKEVHFFDGGLEPEVDSFQKGQEWYRSFFPLKEELENNQLSFEASPLYLFNPIVAKRIYKLIPKAKLIVVLRNPTERAISQYFHEKSLGFEPLPMLDAFTEEENRIKSALDNKNYKGEGFIHSTYKSRGKYKEQLERYYQYFDKNQILIIESNDLFSKTAETLKKVYGFLGVKDDYTLQNSRAQNVSKNRVEVDSEVYDYLDTYFKPYNKALFEFLGEDFRW